MEKRAGNGDSRIRNTGEIEKDIIMTSAGEVEIHFIGHGTLMFRFANRVIHIDPWSELADYAKLPKADIILVTHEHQDHFDPIVLEQLRSKEIKLVLTETCAKKVPGGIVMRNGDMKRFGGLDVEAVPAYNLVHMRSEGIPYHPKGVGNGYVLGFGDKRFYVAGDTENTTEAKNLSGIDVAFLPMNLPYTMTPEMVADVARASKPKILYPYHYGDTDVSRLLELLQDLKDIDVRIRDMK